ncbi:MAG TPA: acyl-CoA thioesterase II [Pseudomonadales bacterium]
MNPVLKNILDILDVEELERNLYRGQNHQTEHVFGGQVLAQAIAAAHRTVEAAHALHSIHSYFLRPGDWNVPIIYEVDRIRDGRSFTTRRVIAIQHGRAIFDMALSFHKPEPGITHAVPMPDVPPPDALRGDREIFAEIALQQPDVSRYAFRFEAIDSRQVERIRMTDAKSHPPMKHTWLKTRDPLPDEPEVHLALLAYMSDLDFMSTSMLPHGQGNMRGNVQGASVDHSLWFHRPFRADDWLLFAKESPNAGGARGFVRGEFFNRQGELVVTAAQECLIRPIASA